MVGTTRRLLAAGVAFAALGATLGCNQRAKAANSDANRNTATDTIPATNPDRDWTDARILRTLATANTLDSALGAFAVKAAHSPGVKDYARTMMSDHGTTNRKVHELASRANIPYDSAHLGNNDPQIKMTEDATDELNDLRKLQGLEFDKGYIKTEVNMHEDLLKTIDKDLIPNAMNVELRGFIEQVRPTVAAHLERAKMIKEELDRGAVPAGTH